LFGREMGGDLPRSALDLEGTSLDPPWICARSTLNPTIWVPTEGYGNFIEVHEFVPFCLLNMFVIPRTSPLS